MKKTLRIIITIALVLAILVCSVWYLFSYDRDFTKDMLLSCARKCESNGNHAVAAWFYNLAYAQSNNNDAVAIELAMQYKSSGNYTKAEYTLYNAISNGGSIDLYIALSKLYLEQDKLLDAVDMLNSVADATIKAELDSLRPATPTASTDAPPNGSMQYNQYITITLTAEDTIYYTTEGEYPTTARPAYNEPFKLPGGKTKVQAVSVNSNGLVSDLASFTYTVADVIELVEFNDSAIEASVREILKMDSETDVYTSDLWSISEFVMPANAKTYADMPRFAFLEKLTIKDGLKDELPYITELSNLTDLTITNTEVTSDALDGIAQLPLKHLTLTKCKIYNIKALKSTISLISLDLSENGVSSVEALSGMVNLQELNLHYNNISNISPLAGCKKLQKLDISRNAITSLAPIAVLTELADLNAATNQISDLGNITGTAALKKLSLSGNSLTGLEKLSNHPSIEDLNVSGNQLTDIAPLATLPKLKYLDFSYNQVSALPAFGQDCALISIDGSRNNLSSLKNLSGLKKLNVVKVEYNTAINSATPLAKCPVLFQVYLYGTEVTDVDILKVQGIVVFFNPIES